MNVHKNARLTPRGREELPFDPTSIQRLPKRYGEFATKEGLV